MEGTDITQEQLSNELLNIDKADWAEEIRDQQAFIDKIGDDMPKEILEEREALLKRFKSL